MISVRVLKSGGSYKELVSKGHAGYDDYGFDIVCSAVSALMINTANSLEAFTEDDFTVDQGGKDGGYLKFSFPEALSDKAMLLMDSLILGLKSIEETYGEQFLDVKVKERT